MIFRMMTPKIIPIILEWKEREGRDKKRLKRARVLTIHLGLLTCWGLSSSLRANGLAKFDQMIELANQIILRNYERTQFQY